MGTTPEYEALAIGLSLLSLLLASVYLWRVAQSYQRWHDERAAVSLGKAVGLTVISFGFLVSSTGFLVENAVLSVAGLSIARGAIIVLLGTLILANVRPGHRDATADESPVDTP